MHHRQHSRRIRYCQRKTPYQQLSRQPPWSHRLLRKLMRWMCLKIMSMEKGSNPVRYTRRHRVPAIPLANLVKLKDMHLKANPPGQHRTRHPLAKHLRHRQLHAEHLLLRHRVRKDRPRVLTLPMHLPQKQDTLAIMARQRQRQRQRRPGKQGRSKRTRIPTQRACA